MQYKFQHIPKPGFLFPPSKPASVTFVWLYSQTSQGYYFAEKGLKTKRVISAGFFPSPGSWCSCVNIQRESTVMTVAEQSCGGCTTLFSSDLVLFCDFKSTRVTMKVEACKAEQMPEMEAELAFPLSTKELFVTQDAYSHLGDGKFWSCEACLLLSR